MTRFATALVGAIQESSGPASMYPENSAIGLMISYMLAKSNTRQDIQDYLEGFLGTPVILPDEEYSAAELESIASKVPDLHDKKAFSDFVCARIYQENYSSTFPKIAVAKKVTYKGFNFTDCVETTVRNL